MYYARKVCRSIASSTDRRMRPEYPTRRDATLYHTCMRCWMRRLRRKQEARRDMIVLGRRYPEIGEFMKMPGVGPVGAHVFAAFIQTPHRFATKPLALLQAGHCGPQHSGQAAGV